MEVISITAKQARRLICQTFHQVSDPLMAAFGIDVAVWVSDILSRMNYFEDRNMLDEDGFFFCNQEEIEKITSLSIFRQNKVIDFLKSISVLEIKKKGLPARLHYKINYGELINVTSKAAEDLKNLNDSFKNFKNLSLKDSINNNIKLNKIKEEITSKEVISTSDEVPSSLSLETSSDKVDRKLYKDSIQPKKPLQQSKPSSDIQSIIDLWEANGLRKTRFGNKTYQDNVKQLRSLLRGTFFNNTSFKDEYSDRKFTVDEIKVAIKRFQNAALDKDYEPTGEYKNRLKGYSISQFIYNPMTTNGERSYLIKCIKTSPKKVSQSVTLKQIPPQVEPIQQVFKSFYLERLRGGLKLKITPQDENNFRDGAIRLYNFIIDNSKQIRTISDDKEIARMMCEAILDWSKGDPSQITSAKFKSDHTYETLLPSKLMNMGVIEEGGY
jgi:hypothetical protein